MRFTDGGAVVLALSFIPAAASGVSVTDWAPNSDAAENEQVLADLFSPAIFLVLALLPGKRVFMIKNNCGGHSRRNLLSIDKTCINGGRCEVAPPALQTHTLKKGRVLYGIVAKWMSRDREGFENAGVGIPASRGCATTNEAPAYF